MIDKRLLVSAATLSIAALALTGCSASADADSGRRRGERHRRRHRHQRRGLRRHRRPRQRRQGRGRAQRHRPAPRLGELRRRSSTPSRRSTRHQDQRGHPRRLERRGDQGRRGTSRARTPPPTSSTSAPPSPLANTDQFAPYKVATWDDIPDATRSRPASGSTTTAAPWRSATTPTPFPARRASTTCSAPSTRARSRSTATRPRPARPSRPSACHRAERRNARRLQHGSRLLLEAEQGGQLPQGRRDPARPSPRARLPSSSTGSYNNLGRGGRRPTQLGSRPCCPAPATPATTTRPINVDAPHPAAARLWQEFLYSDAAQNLCLDGGATPCASQTMTEGRHPRPGALDALPALRTTTVVTPTPSRPRPPARCSAHKWAAASADSIS